ncbi:MAG: sugar phosphate isomerase [Herbinix sp.]|jgi:sugar phosphate isomerase/epimerase|nr:sugar phosphate isomerase [Herbinix sp.]
MKKLPVALQLYSIREEAEKDFAKTMAKVKSMGYDGVELAGLYGHTPEKIKECLNKVGLIPIAAHVSYLEFMADLSATVRKYATIGCQFLVIPYLTEDYRYGTKKFIEVMENIPMIARECHKEGITLLYHNHDFEYARTKEGSFVLDYMYEEIPASVLQTELDTCWIKVAGEEPVEYIRKYSGRCPIVHLKDFVNIPSFDFRAVGYGVQDFPAILRAAVSAGSQWVVVEQDRHSQYSSLEDADLSKSYLESIGW